MNINIKKMRMPLALVGLMLATRFHHFGDSISLPDASLAVFFLAGLWGGGWKFFTILLVEAGLIDYVAISQFSVSDYCISPAYLFLIPTYATLWLAGRYCARFKTLQLTELMIQFGMLFAATTIAFTISNGSFYLLSGKFADLSWVEYTSRVAQYYLPYVTSTLIYTVVIFAIVKIVSSLFTTWVKPPASFG
ncbi:MAG: hypothetical protein L3J75_03710 [Methylococcaceae bacterium]|nr:hypothetical protein [Methylococcaceae bacterium]